MSAGVNRRTAAFRTLDYGSAGRDHEAGMFVARTRPSWKSHWRRLYSHRTPVPPLPDLDWASEIAVGYVLGRRSNGGYHTNIEALVVADGWLDVCALERQPGPSCVTPQAMVNPFHVIAISARTGALRLVERVEVYECG